jgi:hypothetical protein
MFLKLKAHPGCAKLQRLRQHSWFAEKRS